MELGLKNHIVLVTGAAKGIGKGIALACAQEGANLAIHYRESGAEAFQTAEELKKLGVKVCLVQGDIANVSDVVRMKDTIERDLGVVDSIVNNAGLSKVKSFFQYEPEEWRRELEVCFYGVLNLAHVFLPSMKIQGGKFLNIIGDSARTGDRKLIISAAARSGTISFMKSLAQEVGRDSIQCNTIALGMIDQGNLTIDESTMRSMVKKYPLQRLGSIDDVTGMVCFLLSTSSDWITGQVISVNGGYSMMG